LTHRGAETPKPISMKLEIYDYVRDLIPHDKFGGGSSITWTDRQFATSFFSVFFCFLHAYRSHFLADLDDLCTRVSGQESVFLGSRPKLIPPPLAPNFESFALQKPFFASNTHKSCLSSTGLSVRHRRRKLLLYRVAVWCSGSALVTINVVILHRARLVLGWVRTPFAPSRF